MEKAPRPWIKSRCDKGLLWRVNNQGDYIRGYCEFIGNKHTRVHLQKQTYTNQMMGSKQYYHAVSGSRKKCPSFLRNNHCASDNLLMFYSLFRCTRADLLKLLPVWYRTRLHIWQSANRLCDGLWAHSVENMSANSRSECYVWDISDKWGVWGSVTSQVCQGYIRPFVHYRDVLWWYS